MLQKNNQFRIRQLQESLEEIIFVGHAHRVGLIRELYLQPDTSTNIAERMDFDKRCTWILLEALVEMNYLQKKNENYVVPKDIYDRLVDESGPRYEGDFWQFLLYLINPWNTLPYVLNHGKPDISSYRDLLMKDFIKGMDSPWKKKVAPEIVDICLRYCSDAKNVIDIGGAPGTIAKAFVQKGLKVIVFDLPESMGVTKEELSEISEIQILTGDATVELPKGTFDIAFLGNLCHGQSPEDNSKIIDMCYKNLRDNGIIVIFDNLRGEGYRAAILAVHMITQSTKGNVYSRGDYFMWLNNSGFKNINVENLLDPEWQLLIGYK